MAGRINPGHHNKTVKEEIKMERKEKVVRKEKPAMVRKKEEKAARILIQIKEAVVVIGTMEARATIRMTTEGRISNRPPTAGEKAPARSRKERMEEKANTRRAIIRSRGRTKEKRRAKASKVAIRRAGKAVGRIQLLTTKR